MFDDVMLRVHLIVGERYAILVDTAMRGFEAMIEEALGLVSRSGVPLGFVVNTHAHHDHMGLNGWVKARAGVPIVAHPWGRAWIEDPDRNYREFVLGFPDVFGDSAALRVEVLETMGAPAALDLGVRGGEHFYPGGLDVEIVDVSGHVPGEVGLLVAEEKTLVLGDVLIGLEMPMFHGYVNPAQFRRSLATIAGLVASGRVTRIMSAHLRELTTPQEIMESLAARHKLVDEVEALILEIIRQTPRTLKELWLDVSTAKHKRAEFRGLAMIWGHLAELSEGGRLQYEDGRYHAV